MFFLGLDDGRLWIAYLISVTKMTDIGGYFFGNLWGKEKLAPCLSPQKTWIGAIFGFISAIIASLVFFAVSVFVPSFDLTLKASIFLGMLVGIASQLGDLAESLLKRDAKAKDSNSIPGIGGVLDLIDSLLFTTPVVYLFLKLGV